MKLKGKHMRAAKKRAKRLPFDLSYTQSRELSWLQFNARVLHEAADKRVPLYERLRFAAIFTSNLDEFYMVRAGALDSLAHAPGDAPDSNCGWTAAEQLARIREATGALYAARDDVIGEIEGRLGKYGVSRLRPRDLEGAERAWLDRYFEEEVRPRLSVVRPGEPFPHLENGGLAVALWLGEPDSEERTLGLVILPEGLPPLVRLPGEGMRFILAGQLVRDYAPGLFPGLAVSSRAVIRATRSADIAPDGSGDYRERVRQSLGQRQRLGAVRLEIQGKLKMPAVKALCGLLGLEKGQVFWSDAPLSMGWAGQLEAELAGFPELFYPPFTPRWPGSVSASRPVLEQVLERDLLLHYPYESMSPFLRLMEEAACDPAVTAVSLTVYRVAKQSRLLGLLLDAAGRGKRVTVIFELRARFDEQNNLEWAARLEAAGCVVRYGSETYKCHAKVCLITRETADGVQYITQVGTGNYNEKTAALYTDFSLLTADQEVGADAAALFRDLAAGGAGGSYQVLLAAPAGIRAGLLACIEGECEKARAGLPCGVTIKCNSLTDRGMADALQRASAQGVPVRLLVRGICCLVPGVEGLTENIQIYSIVGRFLEHARAYAFGAEMETVYIGSCDLMTRNLDRRTEVLCPVRDAALAERVRGILRAQLADTAKRHMLHRKKGYLAVRPAEGEAPFHAQAWFMDGN